MLLRFDRPPSSTHTTASSTELDLRVIDVASRRTDSARYVSLTVLHFATISNLCRSLLRSYRVSESVLSES
jgi:hypothetical protein